MAGSAASSDRTLTRTVAVAALAVLLVGLAVLAYLQTLSVRHYDDLSARRSAAVNAASDEVIALLTVKHATATSDLKRLLAGSTAGFHDQLEKQAKTFRNALSAGEVTSTGSIAAAALVSMNGNDAVVGIAAKATVKNKSSPKGEARNYRLTVTVAKIGDRWLVSGLTFVV